MRLLTLLCTLATPTVLEPDSDGTYRIRYNHTTSSFNWIVLGDWGGWPGPLFTSPIQLSVAQSMKRASRMHPPEYVIGLGDNFYFHGVTGVDDPMFEETFEKVYNTSELQCNWHVVLGNHDWTEREYINGSDAGNGWAQVQLPGHNLFFQLNIVALVVKFRVQFRLICHLSHDDATQLYSTARNRNDG